MTGTPEGKTVENERKDECVFITAGTDMRGESWKTVVSDIAQFSETDGERNFAEWLESSGVLAGKRMPLRDMKFSVPGNSCTWECDYYWQDSEIIFASGQEKPWKPRRPTA